MSSTFNLKVDAVHIMWDDAFDISMADVVSGDASEYKFSFVLRCVCWGCGTKRGSRGVLRTGRMGQWTIDGETIERKTRPNHHVDLLQSYGEGISMKCLYNS